MSMYPYPSILSEESVQSYILCLEGSPSDHTTCAHACWEVLGYANRQCEILGIDPMCPGPCPYSFDEAVNTVKNHLHQLKTGIKGATSPNWASIITAILSFLANLIPDFFTGPIANHPALASAKNP